VFVAASTDCFDYLSLDEALDKLVDLEFTTIELPLHQGYDYLKPSQILDDLDGAVDVCHNTRRLNLTAYDVEITAGGEAYYEQFGACCKLAKATKVVTVTVPSGEHGTPFNEEVERLRKLVAIGSMEGVRVAMKSQVGRLSEDPDTVAVLCDNVEGLGLTLDPSQYICGPHQGKSIEKLMKYVYHVHLRDTTKTEMQVRVGQGEVDYGRLIAQLRKVNYNRALSIHMQALPEIDHIAEMRKMRLLLESLLI
jgi:sugar phosphate isomerase/epimerase